MSANGNGLFLGSVTLERFKADKHILLKRQLLNTPTRFISVHFIFCVIHADGTAYVLYPCMTFGSSVCAHYPFLNPICGIILHLLMI